MSRDGRSAGMAGAILAALLVGAAAASIAAAEPTVEITIREHRFDPVETRIPAGERVTLYVVNADSSVEEFESTDLNIEKIIPGGVRARIKIGPLQPGTYKVFGEFHQDTAQGVIVVE